jgi:hypothetical protein
MLLSWCDGTWGPGTESAGTARDAARWGGSMAVVGMAADPLVPTMTVVIGPAVSSAMDRACCRSASSDWSAEHGRRADGQRQISRFNARSTAISSIMRPHHRLFAQALVALLDCGITPQQAATLPHSGTIGGADPRREGVAIGGWMRLCGRAHRGATLIRPRGRRAAAWRPNRARSPRRCAARSRAAPAPPDACRARRSPCRPTAA